MQIGPSTIEIPVEVPQKTENRAMARLYHSWVCILKTLSQQPSDMPGHCSIIHNSQGMELALMSTSRLKDKQNVRYIQKGVVLNLKKDVKLCHFPENGHS